MFRLVEAFASSSTSSLTAPSSTTSLALSMASVDFVSFAHGVLGSGGYLVTIPATASCGWWGCLHFRCYHFFKSRLNFKSYPSSAWYLTPQTLIINQSPKSKSSNWSSKLISWHPWKFSLDIEYCVHMVNLPPIYFSLYPNSISLHDSSITQASEWLFYTQPTSISTRLRTHFYVGCYLTLHYQLDYTFLPPLCNHNQVYP